MVHRNILLSFKYVLFKGKYVKEDHRARSAYYLIAFQLWDSLELRWSELKRGAVPVTCLCFLKFIPLPPYSALYFRKLHFPGSTAHWLMDGFGQWEASAEDGKASAKGVSVLSPPSLLALWLWLLCVSRKCQPCPP